MGGELTNQLVIDCRLAAVSLFQSLLGIEQFGCRQRGEGNRGQLGLGVLPARDNREDFLAIRYHTPTHTSNTSSTVDDARPRTAKLWMNSRLGIGSVSVGQQP
jgi:hypothetical protein